MPSVKDPSENPELRPGSDGGVRTFTALERIRLTIQYHGLGVLIYRMLTFPLRFTPLKRRLRLKPGPRGDRAVARRWYRAQGQPVTIVIPSYRDALQVRALVESLQRTTTPQRVRIIVADDSSGPAHLAELRAINGIEVIAGETNLGFASNVNRGLRAADPEHDVVVLNSDVLATPGWLESLQFASTRAQHVGIVGAKLLYENGTIQFAGTVRNLGAPEWFDHRYRFRPADFGPAQVEGPVLAVTGACMYITRETIDRIGLFEEDFPMAYEDVDFCLRAWSAGLSVSYCPGAELYHLESVTRGTDVGERERISQRVFWSRWGDSLDAREVRDGHGALRIIYVTEDTGVGGGHRDIFEHLNGLRERGHQAELWTLGERPAWFDLHAPVRSFRDYDKLVTALAPLRAIKVATWWNTARPVWLASVTNGIPVYFVQDIETSYYPRSRALQNAVLASYRGEFHYMTISSWNRDRLRELGLDAVLIPPGIDLETFRPLTDVTRRDDLMLALGRSNPLKNLPLTIQAWRRLPEPRPELCLFGIEPELATEAGIRYVTAPTDREVNELFNLATVFVQTSIHEGFCLPPLESMATGGAVVCTDAHGNRDFCHHGENCLMTDNTVDDVSASIARLLGDPQQRERLGANGIATAADYAWERRLSALEQFLDGIATRRSIVPSTDVVPQIRR
ncbi:MAG: glycosyltransferase [Solirubrobacteraceae bacterium]